MAQNSNNLLNTWIKAARPQTLPAAFVPVLLGAGLAIRYEVFSLAASGVALLCALLIQIGTNFANDYFDFIKGADTDERVGFQRATASGLISARQMKGATFLTMGIAFLFGLYLVWVGGWPILFIGIFSLACGIAYTGGPFPLGYNGLGDFFVFLFFGIIAVTGTYYVNSLEWSWIAFYISLPIGALSTNILVVNNLRDIEQDRLAGKKTLGVLWGSDALQWEYILMGLISLLVPIFLFAKNLFDAWILLPLLTLPMGISLTRTIWTVENKSRLNRTLEHTGQWMTLYGILFALGIVFG